MCTKKVEKTNNPQVASLLLGFCDLTKSEQGVFIDELNCLLFVSPKKRRLHIDRLKAINEAKSLED